MVTGGAYWGALWLVGLNARQAAEVAVGYRIAGFALALSLMALIAVMGETWIEDLVKVALIDGLALIAWFQVGDRAQTVLLGVLVGSTLILGIRFVTRRRILQA